MPDPLDMSLDDLHNNSHKQRGGGRGGRRTTPYSRPRRPANNPTVLRSDTGSKIILSHLPNTLTYDEIHELVSTVGEIRKLQLNYDEKGQFRGNANVVFRDPAGGARAVERFHGVTLDGLVMKVEVAVVPPTLHQKTTLTNVMQSFQLTELHPSRGRGGIRGGGRRRGAGRGSDPAIQVTMEDLDADMESHLTEQTAEDSTLLDY